MKLPRTTTGEGRPVVLLHGQMWDSTCWDGVRAGLGAGWATVALDLRGHGASPSDGPFAFDALVEDVRESHGTERPLVVGHSLGGYVAAAWALAHPEEVGGLLLVAPSLHFPDALRDVARGMVNAFPTAAPALAAQLLEMWSPAAWRDAHPARVAAEIARIGALPASWVSEVMLALLDGPDLRDAAARLPARLLYGIEDTTVPLADWRGDPERVTLVPGCGHLLPIEAPGVIVEGIRGFWGSDDPDRWGAVTCGPGSARDRR